MRIITLILLLIFSSVCLANEDLTKKERKAKSLCKKFGRSSLYMDIKKAEKYGKKIAESEIGNDFCEKYAKQEIERLSPDYKKSLCEHLAAFYYKGNLDGYKKTLQKIEHAQFADEECILISEFFMRRITRKEEKSSRVSLALNQLSQKLQDRNSSLYKVGTYYNPVYVKMK